MRPLEGIKVLDFGTLLPGPLASLILGEAGAEVVKIERPVSGDTMRQYVPKFGADSVNFALLNRSKRSLALDLKAPDALATLQPLIIEADIVIEQFRPGVLDRLGFGYDALAQMNPRIIFASITGYGQTGSRVEEAGHDLNFCAQTGLLSLAVGADGSPGLPAALVADIAGGAYPAVINILLALRQRDKTGQGCKLDIAMADNLFTFMYWAMGDGLAADRWPRPGAALVTGGSPRYRIYRTLDQRFIAAAPLEDKFWNNFCHLIGLDATKHDEAGAPDELISAVAGLIALKTAEEWHRIFSGHDVCCSVVATVQEALSGAHFRERGILSHSITAEGKTIHALPVPVAAEFRSDQLDAGYPALGEANASATGSIGDLFSAQATSPCAPSK